MKLFPSLQLVAFSTLVLYILASSIPLALAIAFSLGHCLAVLHMSREICKLYRKSGALFTAHYLKQSNHMILWYTGSRGSVKTSPKVKRASLSNQRWLTPHHSFPIPETD